MWRSFWYLHGTNSLCYTFCMLERTIRARYTRGVYLHRSVLWEGAIWYAFFMGTRQVALAVGEFYHLYNRGNSKQTIFKDRADYYHFLKLLFISNSSDAFVFRDIEDITFWSNDRNKPYIAIGAYMLDAKPLSYSRYSVNWRWYFIIYEKTRHRIFNVF